MKVIFEGLWAVGKTTCCEYLRDNYGFCFLEEPDHKKEKLNIINLDDWYLTKHLENIKKSILIENKNIVIERSLASTLAYSKSREEFYKINNHDLSLFQESYRDVDACIILHINYKDYLIYKENLQNDSLRDFIRQNTEFFKNYENNLIYFCQSLFGKDKVHIIDIANYRELIPLKFIFSKINSILFK